jgi:hypothetical protein
MDKYSGGAIGGGIAYQGNASQPCPAERQSHVRQSLSDLEEIVTRNQSLIERLAGRLSSVLANRPLDATANKQTESYKVGLASEISASVARLSAQSVQLNELLETLEL